MGGGGGGGGGGGSGGPVHSPNLSEGENGDGGINDALCGGQVSGGGAPEVLALLALAMLMLFRRR